MTPATMVEWVTRMAATAPAVDPSVSATTAVQVFQAAALQAMAAALACHSELNMVNALMAVPTLSSAFQRQLEPLFDRWMMLDLTENQLRGLAGPSGAAAAAAAAITTLTVANPAIATANRLAIEEKFLIAAQEILDRIEVQAKLRRENKDPAFDVEKTAGDFSYALPFALAAAARYTPYRTLRILLYQEGLFHIACRADRREDLPEGWWALAEAFEAVLQALAVSSPNLHWKWDRILSTKQTVVEHLCGSNPVQVDDRRCRICSRWNPSGRPEDRTASWQWPSAPAAKDQDKNGGGGAAAAKDQDKNGGGGGAAAAKDQDKNGGGGGAAAAKDQDKNGGGGGAAAAKDQDKNGGGGGGVGGSAGSSASGSGGAKIDSRERQYQPFCLSCYSSWLKLATTDPKRYKKLKSRTTSTTPKMDPKLNAKTCYGHPLLHDTADPHLLWLALDEEVMPEQTRLDQMRTEELAYFYARRAIARRRAAAAATTAGRDAAATSAKMAEAPTPAETPRAPPGTAPVEGISLGSKVGDPGKLRSESEKSQNNEIPPTKPSVSPADAIVISDDDSDDNGGRDVPPAPPPKRQKPTPSTPKGKGTAEAKAAQEAEGK
ncbi:hypothetical protein A4X13_0g7395, partial [Tilletia indica]